MLFPRKSVLYGVGAFFGAPLSLCLPMEVHESPEHSSNVINKRDVENLFLFKEIGSQFALPNEIIETILKIRVKSQFFWFSFPPVNQLQDACKNDAYSSGGMKFTCTGISGEAINLHSISIFSFGEYCGEPILKYILCTYETKTPFNVVLNANFDGMIFTPSKFWADKKFLSRKTEVVEVYRSENPEDIKIYCEK